VAIKCPKCHSDNTDTARFCSNCATSLTSLKTSQPAVTEPLKSPARVIAPGTVFGGRYEILDSIGAGGMGEVYRALDKNLSRQVAIKILPAAFAEDKERLARFEREARLLAALNHPNIAAIHGLEESEGRRFLVLELAEGETLQARLDKGALPLEDTLEIGRQLAEGLEAAHEKGIIHRDLKPGNIMITPEGKVKILDFGLARAFHDQISDIDLAKSPTITAGMTQPGVILGTAAYMSPEQAKGKPVDRRADVWAFGCILYECLTGKRAFRGETITETLAAILKGEPDWNALPADTPPSIRRLLFRCLSREQGHRLSDMHDVGIEIADSNLERLPVKTAEISNRYSLRRFPLGMAAIIVGLSILGTLLVQYFFYKKTAERPPSIVRFAIPGEFTASGLSTPALALSPDGNQIVFIGKRNGRAQLFLRSLDRLQSSPLDGTENASGPFFSPDSQRIGFYADGKLKSLAISGGAPTAICEAFGAYCGSWGQDGAIVYTPRWGSGLYRVSAAGGTPTALTTLNPAEKEVSHVWPQVLSGGKAVLFTIIPGDIISADDSLIAVQVIGQKEHRILVRGGSYGRYLASGHLVYERKGTLLAVPFDLRTFQVTGTPAVVLDNLQSQDWTGVAHFAVSDTGTLVYALGGADTPDRSLAWVDLRGHAHTLVADRRVVEPTISSDGRIAMRIAAANDDIWVYTPERQQLARVTFDLGDELYPVWTPDGKRIIYCGGRTNILWKAADGSGQPELLLSGDTQLSLGSVSPDGRVLAFCQINPGSRSDICFLSLKEKRKPAMFLATSFNETSPKFSPNGLWLAYASDESGRSEIYLQRVQGPGGKRQVSTSGGSHPMWSHAGDKLFFFNGNKMMVAKVDPDSGAPGSVELLLELQNLFPDSIDIGPNDDGFTMVVNKAQPPATELHVVLNWFEELNRLVPTGKK
jgi:serine/threonine protein kinase